MPIYEFKCLQCDESFEELVRCRSDQPAPPKVQCPRCGSLETERQPSAFGCKAEGGRFTSSTSSSCGSGCSGGSCHSCHH